MRDREYERVIAVARASVIGRLMAGALSAWSAAAAMSRVVALSQRATMRFAAWPNEDRVRLVALIVVWVCLAYAAARVVLPRYVSSGLPLAWTGLELAAALVVAAFPAAFVRAWRAKFLSFSKPA